MSNNNKNTTSPSQLDQEKYQKMAKYYGIDIQRFFEDVYNAALDQTYDCLDLAETELKILIPDANPSVITESINKLDHSMQKSIAAFCDAFELYCTNNVFVLPPNFSKASLQQFKDLENQLEQLKASSLLSEDDDEETDDEDDGKTLAELQEEIQSVSVSIREMQKEQEIIQTELEIFEQNKASLEAIPKILKEENIQDFTNYLQTVYSHATQLMERIDSCNKYDTNLAHLQQSSKQASHTDAEKIFKDTSSARLDVLLDKYNHMHDKLIPTHSSNQEEEEDDPMLE